MEIKVEYYGILAEITGKNHELIMGCTTLSEVNTRIQQLYPVIKSQKYSLAVNDEIITGDKIVEANSVVCFMPPFSGG